MFNIINISNSIVSAEIPYQISIIYRILFHKLESSIDTALY